MMLPKPVDASKRYIGSTLPRKLSQIILLEPPLDTRDNSVRKRDRERVTVPHKKYFRYEMCYKN